MMFFGFKQYLFIGGFALISFLLMFTYLKGRADCEKAHELKVAALTLDWADDLAEADEENRELERKLLKKEVIVEEKIVETIKEIPKYITIDNCRVNSAGVQHLRGRVSELFPEAK